MRQALPRRPSRPKNLDWPGNVHGRCLEPGSNRPPFQAGCRRCSDVTKPLLSVGVSNRSIDGVLTHRAFRLAGIVPWRGAGVSRGWVAMGQEGASTGRGGALLGVGGGMRCWAAHARKAAPAGVCAAHGRRRRAPKKNPARGRAESCCHTGPLREEKRVPSEGVWAVYLHPLRGFIRAGAGCACHHRGGGVVNGNRTVASRHGAQAWTHRRPVAVGPAAQGYMGCGPARWPLAPWL